MKTVCDECGMAFGFQEDIDFIKRERKCPNCETPMGFSDDFKKAADVMMDFASLYRPEEFCKWFSMPNPSLNNHSPYWCISHGDLDLVIALMEHFTTGANA